MYHFNIRSFIASVLLCYGTTHAMAVAPMSSPPQDPPLVYGERYHLQNGYANWSGGYLDTRAGPCQDNPLCVSTARTRDRDAGSGTWVIASAEGKLDGTPVMRGERVYLKNEYPYGTDTLPPYDTFGGYLDTRGNGCIGNLRCVSTSLSPNTGVDTSVWVFVSKQPDLHANQPVHLQNLYPDPRGFAYLDTRGGGCQGNLLCVSASKSPDRDIGSGWWRLVKADSEDAMRGAPLEGSKALMPK